MQVIEKEGLKISVDDDGFLTRTEDWTEPIARVLAHEEGIADLPKAKLDILKFLRKYYQANHFFPIVRAVCKQVHQASNCVTEQFANPVQAWRIAGLPNPGEEVIGFKTWEPLGF